MLAGQPPVYVSAPTSRRISSTIRIAARIPPGGTPRIKVWWKERARLLYPDTFTG